MKQNQPNTTGKRTDSPPVRPSSGRKLAEWITMGLSLALILGVAGYLSYHAFQEEDSFISVTVSVLPKQIQKRSDQYLLPIEIRNQGERTVRHFKADVSWHSTSGQIERREIKLDYLGGKANQRVYLYFEQNPVDLPLQARSLEYRLD